MTNPSFRDVEQLSASLDGQLSQAESTRLEARLRSSPELAVVLADLRQARVILHRTPKRRLARNFTLTPRMAGVKPPVPRLVPALSWASAAAMLLFVFTLGTNLLGRLSFGTAAPMLAAAPMASEGYGMGGGPAATQPSATDGTLVTSTPEAYVMSIPEGTPQDGTRLIIPPTAPLAKDIPAPDNIWPIIWLGLAVVLIAAAFLMRRASIRAFRRKVGRRHDT
jgi:anti-sigma factor RsiW